MKASLGGLAPGGKSVQQHATEDQIKAFASGAATNYAVGAKPSVAVFKRTTFSLTDEMNAEIDQLVLAPRTFKVCRSDVVRAGVRALQRMDADQVIALLAEVSGNEVTQVKEGK